MSRLRELLAAQQAHAEGTETVDLDTTPEVAEVTPDEVKDTVVVATSNLPEEAVDVEATLKATPKATLKATPKVTLEARPAELDLPSVHSAGVLVDVHFKQWQARRKDTAASKKVTADSGAVPRAASVHKSLLPNCPQHKAVKDYVANMRQAHYAMTLPWSDRGPRLLPAVEAQVMRFHEHITTVQVEFDRLCNEFFDVYEWERTQAEARLGDLFNPANYPSLDEVKSKYHMRIAYMPVPESGDFRVDMGNEAIDLLKTHYEDFYTSSIEMAMRDMWERLYVPLANMSQRLDYGASEQKTNFRNTLVSNVVDIVDMLKDFNLTNDVQLEACRVKLEATMRGVTSEGLRDDAGLRLRTKKQVDSVLDEFSNLMQGEDE